MNVLDVAHGSSSSVQVGVEGSVAGTVWRSQAAIYIADLMKEKHFAPGLQWLRELEIHSYYVLPVSSSRTKLGAFGLASKRSFAFSQQDLQFLDRVADMVALAVDTSLPSATVEREVSQLKLLFEIAASFDDSSALSNRIVMLLAAIQKWAAHEVVGLYVYDETAKALRLEMSDPALAQKMMPEGLLAPLEGTLAGQAFRSGRSMILDYASLSAIPFASVKHEIELGVRSLCLVPLLSAKGAVGVLRIARLRDRAFSGNEAEFFERIAAIIAAGLDRTIYDNQENAGELTIDNAKAHLLAGDPAVTVSAFHQTVQDRIDAHEISGDDKIPFSVHEALMDSEELRAAYSRTSNVGFCILDSDLRYHIVNDALARMNGISPAAHIGKTIREVLGDFAEMIEPYLRRVLATGGSVSNLELASHLPSRSEPGHWLIQYVPLRDPNGEVKHVGAVVLEVTEQKKLEESLRDVSETLRREKERNKALIEISRLLETNWDVPALFRKISARLRRVLLQEYAALAIREGSGERLISKALDFPMGRSQEVGGEIGAAIGTHKKALAGRLPVILNREQAQQLSPGIASSLASEGLKSLCCIPLARPKGRLGVLVLGSTRADAFKNDDLSMLNQVAAQLGIALENANTAREIKELKRLLKQEQAPKQGASLLRPASRSHPHFEAIKGSSAAIEHVLDQVDIISSSDATVLILGETGTGKGLIAQAIHKTSKRNRRSFVTLNCAAIPTGLLESELFGHEKGAFTGAVSQKIGRLELADGGTLFLDEIGEIALELQPKLLRVLQDHEFERLGGTRTIKVDLRLIAATNRELAASVAQKQFRTDLFYRLNVFPIRLPSLRERREDIPLLVDYFVGKFSAEFGRPLPTIAPETLDALLGWDWPGNVRELQNFIERSVILTDGDVLNAPLREFERDLSKMPEESLQQTEREHIIRVLRETGGVISGSIGAASRLGLKRTTLQSKIQKLGIKREDYSVTPRQ